MSPPPERKCRAPLDWPTRLSFIANLQSADGHPSLPEFKKFSHNGNEVTFASIGNASTAEGMFWESINAIGVLQAPAVITVYDDGYGISVPNQFQMVKENIYAILKGFERDDCMEEECERGYDLYQVRGWDYPALIETYQNAAEITRKYHIPQLIHVIDLTQPQGHSTSGSQERYKSPEQLKWEEEFDCIRKMRAWMIENRIISEPELAAIEKEDYETVEEIRKTAWEAYLHPILEERTQVMDMLDEIAGSSSHASELDDIKERLAAAPVQLRRDIHVAAT